MLSHAPRRPHGAALVTVMVLMGALLALSVVAARLAVLGERGARNDRDAQIAFHAAEAALADAEADLMGSGGRPARRTCALTGFDLSLFEAGCGTEGDARGLCAAAADGAPASLAALEGKEEKRHATFGEFTGKDFAAKGAAGGTVPPPRYIVEAVPYTAGFGPSFRAFRVTAVGYGPQGGMRTTLQALIVKPVQVAGCAA